MANFLDDYQPVEDRLRLFWGAHPYGRVITELLHHGDGDYIVLASVYFGDETKTGPPTATGLAHDSVSSLPANMKASALEVCETSAIGRALANAGYAPKDKRPSREEMAKASGGSTATPSPENQRTSVLTAPAATAGDAPPDTVEEGSGSTTAPAVPGSPSEFATRSPSPATVEEVGDRGEGAPASEAVDLAGFATDAQWAKCRTLQLTKAAVLKAIQAQGFTEITKATQVPAAAMAELLATYGVDRAFR